MLKSNPCEIKKEELYEYIYDLMGEKPIRTKIKEGRIGSDKDTFEYLQFTNVTVIIRTFYRTSISQCTNDKIDWEDKCYCHFGESEIKTPDLCNECGTIHNIKPLYSYECEDWENTVYICQHCMIKVYKEMWVIK